MAGIEFVFYDCKLAKADQTFLHNTQESSNDTGIVREQCAPFQAVTGKIDRVLISLITT